MLRPTEPTSPAQPPAIAEAEPVDTPTVIVPEVEMQHLAVTAPAPSSKPVPRAAKASTGSRSRNLKAQNDSLRAQNERLQRELADLRRRAFIIDLEANGFRAVQDEDGSIVLIDLEQEIENELNNKLTTNIPAL